MIVETARLRLMRYVSQLAVRHCIFKETMTWKNTTSLNGVAALDDLVNRLDCELIYVKISRSSSNT